MGWPTDSACGGGAGSKKNAPGRGISVLCCRPDGRPSPLPPDLRADAESALIRALARMTGPFFSLCGWSASPSCGAIWPLRGGVAVALLGSGAHQAISAHTRRSSARPLLHGHGAHTYALPALPCLRRHHCGCLVLLLLLLLLLLLPPPPWGRRRCCCCPNTEQRHGLRCRGVRGHVVFIARAEQFARHACLRVVPRYAAATQISAVTPWAGS
jgi:hypothetical protein